MYNKLNHLKISKISLILTLALTFLLYFFNLPSYSNSYPKKNIKLIVPYGPGGATDLQARIMTMNSENFIKKKILIVNKPGAGGQSGWNWVKKNADKDGYILSIYNMPHLIAQSIMESGYDINSFQPIVNWGADPVVLISNSKSKIKNIDQFLSLINQEQTQKFTFSGAGLYVGHHVAFLELKKNLKLNNLSFIPSQTGGVGALKSVISGEVDFGLNNLSDAVRAEQEGTINILAIADLKRNDWAKNVPTFLEKNVNVGNISVNYRGIMASKNIDLKTLNYLEKNLLKMFNEDKTLLKMNETYSPVKILTKKETEKLWIELQKNITSNYLDIFKNNL